jgi:hypothetical protein
LSVHTQISAKIYLLRIKIIPQSYFYYYLAEIMLQNGNISYVLVDILG